MACQAKGEKAAVVPVDKALQLIRENPSSLVWLDFEGVVKGEERALLESEPFRFHELAIEDASKEDGQRPKVEEYEDYFFLVMHAVTVHREIKGISLGWHEVDLFVGANYVISMHRDEVPEVTRVWQDALNRPGITGFGSDRLLYFLLDAVVDRYIEIMDDVEDVLDELEDDVIEPSSDERAVHAIFRFKRQLIDFRKKSHPLRDAINELTSRNFPHITSETSFYLRDVYDHLIRLTDMLDVFRDIMTSALDVHLSAVSNRLNDIMKRLTIVATIFMPLTFLTGFWGMNFGQLPFNSPGWFWSSIVSMAVVSLVMVVVFRTRRYK